MRGGRWAGGGGGGAGCEHRAQSTARDGGGTRDGDALPVVGWGRADADDVTMGSG